MGDWTFFSNYGHVLVCLARNREARLRDVALEVGITERAVQKIVRDLQDAGFLTVTKQGRCNRYSINKRRSLRHGLESQCTVGKLLALVAKPAVAKPAARGISAVRYEGKDQDPGPAAVEEMRPAEESSARREPEVQAPTVELEVSTGTAGVETMKKPGKKKKKAKPVDTREQGSLF